ncbi:hypothetical protein [Gimesia sp.]|uniref:hypothetical protein n=1 Tax=Gimesia sp. TaxID=2024833 RepID=UPI003A948C29
MQSGIAAGNRKLSEQGQDLISRFPTSVQGELASKTGNYFKEATLTVSCSLRSARIAFGPTHELKQVPDIRFVKDVLSTVGQADSGTRESITVGRKYYGNSGFYANTCGLDTGDDGELYCCRRF